MDACKCRVCLQLEELMVHIYEEVEDLQSSLCALLEQCGGIKVDKNDGYPKYLCKECTSELLIAAKFREKCTRTQEMLEQCEKQTNNDGDIVLEANELVCEEESPTEHTNNAEVDNLMTVPADELLNTLNLGEHGLLVPLEYVEDMEAIAEQQTIAEEDLIEEQLQETELILETSDGIIESDGKIEDMEAHFTLANDDANEDIIYEFNEVPNEEQLMPVNEAASADNALVMEQQELPATLTVGGKKCEFSCDSCGAFFIQALNLKRHMSKDHAALQLYECEKCEHCFSIEANYNQHCNSCSYESKKDELVNRSPRQTVHKKKTIDPYEKEANKATHECQYCGKKLQSQFALTTHLRSHTGERPFACQFCEKAFKTQSALNTHLKRHASMPDYACTICDKTFYETSNLTAHMRTHTGEKPHACVYCNKRFTRVFLLQLHLRTHTGEKPYSCTRCARAFAQLCDLKNHMITHTGERRFQCPSCPKKFIRRYPLLLHMQRHSTLSAADLDAYEASMPNEVNETQDINLEYANLTSEACDIMSQDFNLNDLIVEEVE